ncbi:MAG: ATP-binding cassette domain-containing protein, partial [Pseudomonadota bacterium]
LADHRTKTPPQLSGGMRQRAALARTLMEDAELVLLDEPFSALDARTRADMQELAFELLEGRTKLLVTHDPAEAARLGQFVHIMERQGTVELMPPGDPIRAHHAPQKLAFEAQLFEALGQTSSARAS